MAKSSGPKVGLKKKLSRVEKAKHVEVGYSPRGEDFDVQEFISQRVMDMKAERKRNIVGAKRSIEDIWRDADNEYQPHELEMQGRRRLESNDEEGLRSRLVKVGQESEWQSNQASPDFYVKVNTALSILVDQNPEAVFIPDGKKYEANTKLAYGNWKHSWEVSGAKQQLKNFTFNLAKYGVAFMKTYPKLVEQQKQVRTEYYSDQPQNDKYETRRLVKFNDICRTSLNPWDVWVSEMTRPGDPLSMDDWYHEVDFADDKFQEEFKEYLVNVPVPAGARERPENDEVNDDEKVGGITRVGFYENQVLDLYVVFIPSHKIVLYKSPLPNDDGMLSLTTAQWSLRDDRTILGIGLYEIIKGDCVLYDRMSNMSMDQLALSIYKMFFYKGTDILGENGSLVVTAGKGVQVSDPQGIQFLNVPGPGAEVWRGMEFLQERKDTTSGVTPQIVGKSGGNTLGQDVQAKESALQRMKTPLDFIIDALQQEAYICLSWQKQTLSTPEVLEYSDEATLTASLKEAGLDEESIQKYLADASTQNPDSKLLFNGPDQMDANGQPVVDEIGVPVPPRQFANVYREMPYNLQNGDDGELIESKEAQFYRYGTDLPTNRLDWRGIIRIKPQSVLAPSKEITRRMKLDLYNLIYPSIEKMLAQPQFIPMLLPSVKQILKVYDEDINDWVDEDELMKLSDASKQPPPPPPPDPPKLSFSIKLETLPPEVQLEVLKKYAGIDMKPPAELGALPDLGGAPTDPNALPDIFIDGPGGAGGQPPPGAVLQSGDQPPAEPMKPLLPRGQVGTGKTPSTPGMAK